MVKKCYVHNIFTKLSQQILDFNLNALLKLLFYSPETVNNNLSSKTCCKNVINIALPIYIHILLNFFIYYLSLSLNIARYNK